MAFKVGIKVDEDRASEGFKQARRDINGQLRDALKAAAEKEALPATRKVAWSFIRPLLIARATTRSAYVTTRGARALGRAGGLLEFGGTVRTLLIPKKAKALALGPDLIRARVEGPRHYKPTLRLTRAVDARIEQIEQTMLQEIIQAFDAFETHS